MEGKAVRGMDPAVLARSIVGELGTQVPRVCVCERERESVCVCVRVYLYVCV